MCHNAQVSDGGCRRHLFITMALSMDNKLLTRMTEKILTGELINLRVNAL